MLAKTYSDVYIDATKQLKQAGIESPDFEARILLSYAADKPIAAFYRDLRLYCSSEFAKKAEELVIRRVNGEPCAYITGYWEFFGLPFHVTKSVLIPRTDSEVVAQAAIDAIGSGKARVLDLCSGSGCLGIAIAKNLSNIRLTCVDISQEALKISRGNARLNRITHKVSFLKASVFDPPPKILSNYDLIICNPPYIKTDDIASLDTSVRDYEPRIALDGGKDGLSFYRAVCEKWLKVLNIGGHLVFECGIGQSSVVAKIAFLYGLTHIKSVEDTLGIERAVVFSKDH